MDNKGKMQNLGNMLQNSPKQRNIYLSIVAIAVAAVGFGFYSASKSRKTAGITSGAEVGSVPQVTVTPGASTSEAYNESLKKNNETLGLQALEEGKTFQPTPVNMGGAGTESPIDLLDREVKAQREREAAEMTPPPPPPPVEQPVVQQVVVQQPVQAPPPPKYFTDEDYALVAALRANQAFRPSRSEFNYYGGQAQEEEDVLEQRVGQVAAEEQVVGKAGTIYHAVLETAVNSDEPSPVLAKIISGELKGTRLVGRMVTTGKKVVLEFTTASVPHFNKSLKIQSIAVDANTNRTALADSVDNHYFLKYGTLIGAAFLSSYADALTQQNTVTSVTPNGNIISMPKGNQTNKEITRTALGGVGKEFLGSVRSTAAALKPTIKVNAGAPIGILLMEDFIVK